MRKTFILSADEAMTLIMLSRLNSDIMANGMTKENNEALIILQEDLLEIVRKITYMK